jgi:hypothetical protein
VAYGHNQDLFWLIAVNDQMWKSMDEAAAHVHGTGESLETLVEQRFILDTLKCPFDFVYECITKMRALLVIPFGRHGDFEVDCR